MAWHPEPRTMTTNEYFDATGLRPLSAQQLAFLRDADKYDVTLFGGGVGAGKTIVLCLKLIEWATKYPSLYFLGRQSYKSLSMTTEKVWRELAIPSILADYNKQEGKYTIRSANGMVSEVYLVHYDTWQHLMSANLGGFAVDQAEEIPEDVFTMLMSRLRHRLGPRKAILSANPAPGYLKRLFMDEPQKGFHVIHTQTRDNPYLPSDYEERLRGFWPEAVARRYLEGSWDVMEGSIYPMFRKDIHVVPVRSIPENWLRVGGLDYGFRNPTVVLWAAIDPDGTLWVYDEYYETNALPERQVNQIKARGSIAYIAADPSIRNRQGITGTSVMQEYLDRGLAVVEANNDVAAGIARVGQFLDWSRDAEGELIKTPQLYITENCFNLIREMGNYHWKDIEPGSMTDPQERPAKVDDHACFVAGTMVHSSKGVHPIEQVKPGDCVLTRRGYQQVSSAGQTGKNTPVYEVCFSDGRSLVGTETHPVWVRSQGWTALKNLQLGDEVFPNPERAVEPVVVVSRARIVGRASVYNLQVENCPEYFANGVLVHNCDALRYLVMSRPQPEGSLQPMSPHERLKKNHLALDNTRIPWPLTDEGGDEIDWYSA